jgi:hypothetical protein
LGAKDVETATQTLHRLTSLEAWDEEHGWDPPVADPRVVTSFEPNDIERLPWFYKRYPDELPSIALPRDLPTTSAGAVDVLAGIADVPPAELDLAQLSRLLHLSAGITRTTVRPYTTWLFRAAGSAGGRFPLEVYVSVPEWMSIPAGVYWYHPQRHALVLIGPPPTGGGPAIVVTGVPWRTGWRYRERGYRHVYWDAGTMLSQLLALGDSAGLEPRLYTRFPDAQVALLVGADRVHEWPVAVVALAGHPPALEPIGPAAVGEVDAAPLEFPLETAAQRAGETNELRAPWATGAAVEPSGRRDGRSVEAVIGTRGSQRLMDPTRGLPEVTLRTCMHVAMRGIDLPHRVVVHDVEGLVPGVYRWPDLSAPVRGGDLREELYHVCLDQGLGRDAAFVAIAATDVSSLDDHTYREAHLAAGLVEGRLHLVAYAMDASACGMTFADGQIRSLLGEQLDALLFTCVGVPEYRSALGGPPGAPVDIRMRTPRM